MQKNEEIVSSESILEVGSYQPNNFLKVKCWHFLRKFVFSYKMIDAARKLMKC